MPMVISSKWNDFSAWRAAENPGALFRHALLKRGGALPETGQDEIRECLETASALQRHVGVIFSGREERTAC